MTSTTVASSISSPSRFRSSRVLVRAVALTAATVATLAGSALLEPALAQAAPRTVTVTTGAGPVNVREGAGTNTRLLRTIPNGSKVTIVCFVRGQTFTGGPFRVSTNVWDRLDSGGYVTDAMLETGSNNPVVPQCPPAQSNQPASSGSLRVPLNGNPAISRGFGGAGHNGIDYAVGTGTPVYAAAAGTVHFEGYGQNNQWMKGIAGISVLLRHSDQFTGYAHLSRTVINNGQPVIKGS